MSSIHEPRVRNGLCRRLRSKGILVSIGTAPEKDIAARQRASFLGNELPTDTTVWWCDRTATVIGPDDRPCHADRCTRGRACHESEDEPVA
jgi:hypothetical protein